MSIASYIDHTVLKANATEKEVLQVCEEAKEYGFASVCVNLYNTKMVTEQLKGSSVKTCTVVGFPLGAVTKEVKAFETKCAIEDGAQEIDMVINVAALKDKKYDEVYNDIKAVVDTAKNQALVKVILETCLLTDEEKEKACELAVSAKADFVKTSTGFSTGGATVEDIQLMKRVVGDNAKVKASGGVRTYETAKAVIDAGADRIGASSSIAITTGKPADNSGY